MMCLDSQDPLEIVVCQGSMVCLVYLEKEVKKVTQPHPSFWDCSRETLVCQGTQDLMVDRAVWENQGKEAMMEPRACQAIPVVRARVEALVNLDLMDLLVHPDLKVTMDAPERLDYLDWMVTEVETEFLDSPVSREQGVNMALHKFLADQVLLVIPGALDLRENLDYRVLKD